MKDTAFSKKKTLTIRGNMCDFSRPLVMGILNVTPDSFYDGTTGVAVSELTHKAMEMTAEGADIIDVGGMSTRPGASEISVQEEIDRVIPVIDSLLQLDPQCFVSIDTFRAEVAREALAHGASMVNDISGGTLDSEMLELIAEKQVPYVLMHMRGTPETMSSMNHYDHLLSEIINFFSVQSEKLDRLGYRNCLILDPGIGFAKDLDQNFKVISGLSQFKTLNLPLLVGLSRKSFIYKSLGIEPSQALIGTVAMNMVAIQKGANILRVHDVKEAVQIIQLSSKM